MTPPPEKERPTEASDSIFFDWGGAKWRLSVSGERDARQSEPVLYQSVSIEKKLALTLRVDALTLLCGRILPVARVVTHYM